jgi:TonB family protein
MHLTALALAAPAAPQANPAADTAAAAEAAEIAQMTRNAKNLNVLHSFYPKRALAAGEQGQVGFKVTLDVEGHPTSCQVTRSSGYPLLDEETCRLITINAVFKRHNSSVETRSGTSTHEGVIKWELPPNAAALAAPPPPAPVTTATAVPEKLVCRRTRATGAIARYERVCATPAEWGRAAHESREFWENNRKRGFTGGGG